MNVKHFRMNFDDLALKRRLQAAIGAATGWHTVTITTARGVRSDVANAYYFGVVVQAYIDFEAQQGNAVTKDKAHTTLATWNNPMDVPNPATGEVKQVAAPTHVKDSHEFYEYVERCRAWLASFGVATPDPDPDYMAARERARRKTVEGIAA